MNIRIRKSWEVRSSEITPETTYLDRRRFLTGAGALGLGAVVGVGAWPRRLLARPLDGIPKGPFGTDEEWTDEEFATEYTNFIELGSGKEGPSENAHLLKTEPWTIAVDGHVEKPGTYDVADLIRAQDFEERIYRLRCVETWSMVIPWIGVPLADVIKRLSPLSKAKYVVFETLHDPEMLPRQGSTGYPWPYREGLRLDEALNPLVFLAVGMYGETLPAQNGAPVRLVVPWKYGFKSIKSVVRIGFVEDRPTTLWNDLQPEEYGFYANVNPDVEHPRWSQAKERRIGEFFRRETEKFNGYGDEVAHLYSGMDLKLYY